MYPLLYHSICISAGHSEGISSVCFSHDGTRMISGSEDKTVKIWDAKTGKCVNTLEGEGFHIIIYIVPP